ncbi:MAG: proteasome subunit beta, partial [Propionibacteriaceae bacterium]|nr:proteasome subunit beta [Propionibacteriaceae bacterium]
TGGRYEESGFHAVGSGAPFARGSLKKTYRADSNEAAVALTLVQALFDAADEDSATGGPDAARSIFPVVFAATAAGVRRYPDSEVAELSSKVVVS